ncbi:hypothetical protein SPLC1_S541500 [Arthrospira platensis C1]|nr:hypothetical protein SPLC1_S541500 [Arthrospira platensis C1]
MGAGLLILSSIIENYPVGGGGFINIVVDNSELTAEPAPTIINY